MSGFEYNENIVTIIFVRFKDPVGVKTRGKNDSVAIERFETTFTVSKNKKGLEIKRRQFPLKLSFATTIHKIQGQTIPSIVVDFSSRFGEGMAYVAVTRTRTLEDLYILNFDAKKFKTNLKVENEMNRIEKHMLTDPYKILTEDNSFVISCINARSMVLHYADIVNDPVCLSSKLLLVTETWLNIRHNSEEYTPKEYNKILRIDKTCTNTDRTTPQQTTAGGIAACVHSSVDVKILKTISRKEFQILVFTVSVHSVELFTVVLVYRSPNSPPSMFTSAMEDVITIINGEAIIVGDFNENSLTSTQSHIHNYFQKKKFAQQISEATHSSGSCIDHVYTNNINIHSCVLKCYFSDHDWIIIKYKTT